MRFFIGVILRGFFIQNVIDDLKFAVSLRTVVLLQHLLPQGRKCIAHRIPPPLGIPGWTHLQFPIEIHEILV